MSDPNYPYPPQGYPPPGYQVPPPAPPPQHDGGWKIPVLFGTVLALVGANIYLYKQIDGLKQEVAKNQEAIVNEIGQVRQSASASTLAARRNIESLKDELETARRQANMAVGQAKIDATKHAEELARKLDQQQKASSEALKSDIKQVEAAASTANTKIGEVSTEVSAVKTDVAATRGDLEKTKLELKSTIGDLGVQSGLIATNGKELAQLKALGERNYFEFNIKKAKEPQRVGDVLIQLTKADVKKNKYTMLVIADDKRVEKKDKGTNEPIQFYTSKARQPYEIVVNEVKKDQIVGYLATPKVTTTRN